MSAHGMSEAGGLREAWAAVEAVLTEAEMNTHPMDPSSPRVWVADVRAAHRKALAAHPAPEADPTAGERGCRWSDARGRWEWEIRPGVSKEACGHLAHTRGDDLYMPDERPVIVTSATPDADDANHVRTVYGTTTCPVERVRAEVDDDDDTCSACGAKVPDADDASTGAGEGLSEAERDATAMALVDIDPDPCDPIDFDAPAYYREFAAALLASDWLAAREAAAAKAAGERALLEAADDFEAEQRRKARERQEIHPWSVACGWLRDRAARIAREDRP